MPENDHCGHFWVNLTTDSWVFPLAMHRGSEWDVGLIAVTCHMLLEGRTIHHHWTYVYKLIYARASLPTRFAEG